MEPVPVVKHIIRNSASLTKQDHKQPQLKTQISLLCMATCMGKKKVFVFFVMTQISFN